ncbi:hypothetical protein JR316_0006080 [Psilocybe cubensis]|uniref:YhhN-like protein n=2 Tax=Psilocybe cubensis TaxID=181762 RepID=A0A8H7Y0R7_PSICU|nr:hypothetical protein JR316_0006080 [Psilocybe cubensis]KAH9481553.1 hypothetical protein JR316_0006080 [Psilocybe cubensis]
MLTWHDGPAHWQFILLRLGFKLPVHPYPLALAVSVVLLIISEANSFYAGSSGFKIAASLSFLGAGIQAAGATGDAPFRSSALMVAGLAFSLVGDIFLIPTPKVYAQKMANSKSEAGFAATDKQGDSLLFKAGTFFFALAHISYIAAFLSDSSLAALRVPDFALAASFGAGLIYWLGILQRKPGPDAWFNVPQDMRGLVIAYVTIIMTMVATATATDKGHQKIVGAWTFMISDLFVAADAFGVKKDRVQPSHGQRGWKARSVGWIAYFGAQLLLAGSI